MANEVRRNYVIDYQNVMHRSFSSDNTGFRCTVCDRVFTDSSSLERHLNSKEHAAAVLAAPKPRAGAARAGAAISGDLDLDVGAADADALRRAQSQALMQRLQRAQAIYTPLLTTAELNRECDT